MKRSIISAIVLSAITATAAHAGQTAPASPAQQAQADLSGAQSFLAIAQQQLVDAQKSGNAQAVRVAQSFIQAANTQVAAAQKQVGATNNQQMQTAAKPAVQPQTPATPASTPAAPKPLYTVTQAKPAVIAPSGAGAAAVAAKTQQKLNGQVPPAPAPKQPAAPSAVQTVVVKPIVAQKTSGVVAPTPTNQPNVKPPVVVPTNPQQTQPNVTNALTNQAQQQAANGATPPTPPVQKPFTQQQLQQAGTNHLNTTGAQNAANAKTASTPTSPYVTTVTYNAGQKVQDDRLTKLENAPKPADGKDGLNGKDGKDGVNGTNGKDGLNGKDGAKGQKGDTGLTGAAGKDGLNGKDGKDGAAGKTGLAGKSGVNGKDGKDADMTKVNANTQAIASVNSTVTSHSRSIAANHDAIQRNSKRIDNLEGDVKDVKRQVKAIGATATAAANLHYNRNESGYAVAVGEYEGATAVAGGLQFNTSTNTAVTLQASYDGEGVGASVGFHGSW